MMKIAFFTLGCKVNQYESAVLEGMFEREGFLVVPPEQDADVYVINSCTVTATADQKSRQMLRKFRRAHPDAVLVLTGCYPQTSPKAAELPEADLVTGTAERTRLPALVMQFLADRQRKVEVLPHTKGEPFEPMYAERFAERTRAFVKIEDGCDRYCSYCMIPYARGHVRSKTPEAIVDELTRLSAAGHHEIVLSGINLPCYGADIGLRLVDALEAAATVPGIRRLRLGSLEPEILTERDLERMAALPQFFDQFHLALQSGCDATLRRMHRRYTTAEYAAQVALLRQYFPNAAVTTDVMTGFPGETDEEFARSLSFVESIGFAKVHVFAYSRRPGTVADRMPDQVPNGVKNARARLMIDRCEATTRAFLETQVGRTDEVLFEQLVGGLWEGSTRNGTTVRVQSDESLAGAFCQARLTGVSDEGCCGILV